ncbi:hypothetical protein [Falsibacillus pallidus]|uniref:Group-specific protein n=1 Tax=Falsibacillus pallidus TaxID=493781 RepID=A0A370GQH5_9BACI|nr:hypothetical protein [Falsibacillus pallidus]RDI45751.1 hypothetical protein DFR59_102384 [Falsibacillus pallidus]
MRTKLILVEGLPGFGKSTTANFVKELLEKQNEKVELFLEGNLDHPADYDGVAYLTEDEFDSLMKEFPEYTKAAAPYTLQSKGNHMLISYVKMKNDIEAPDEFWEKLSSRDIYELTLDVHMKLITERWEVIAEQAAANDVIYIFECCFIQNPVTMSLVKYNESDILAMEYVQRLAAAVDSLNPLLLYVTQNDLEKAFLRAVEVRPKEWSTFFMDYYCGQGYGKANGYEGLEGTIEVLKKRHELEMKIFHSLKMEKFLLDNSAFDRENHQSRLEDLLKGTKI